jgi:type VI secretion system protein ImpA
MLIISELLLPISAENSCGEDLSFSSEVDEIAQARVYDDPTLDQGEWVAALKEADWDFVATRCARMLAGRSKDLRLAVWLAEALAKTHGLRSLGDGYAVLTGLCEHYWDGLHPLGRRRLRPTHRQSVLAVDAHAGAGQGNADDRRRRAAT